MNNMYIVDDCKTPVTKSEMMPTASCDWEQVANSTLQHLLPIKSGMKKESGRAHKWEPYQFPPAPGFPSHGIAMALLEQIKC